MTIENKPIERLIQAFREGRFDVGVDEVFAPVAMVKPLATTTTATTTSVERQREQPEQWLRHYNSCTWPVSKCPQCIEIDKIKCNCGDKFVQHIKGERCTRCACNHFGMDGLALGGGGERNNDDDHNY